MKSSPPLTLERFHPPEKKPVPLSSHPNPSSASSHYLLSVPIDLPVLAISHKWNQTVHDWFLSFTCAPKVHPWCQRSASFLFLFLFCQVLCHMDTAHFIYPLTSEQWIVSFLGHYANSSVEYLQVLFVWMCVFVYFGYTLAGLLYL